MNNSVATLHAELQRAFGTQKAVLLPASRFGLTAGLETLERGTPYRWDGMKRGGDPLHPFLVLQTTLAGWGTYNGERVALGKSFAALVPGAHVYQMPAASPGWTYFWIILSQPYICERVRARQADMGGVVDAPPESGLATRTAQLAFHVCAGGWRDRWAEEEAVFGWLCEYERTCDAMQYPAAPRNTLLADVRDWVRRDLTCPPDVSALARERGQSRSAFAHAFKKATGMAPAAFTTQVRLEHASRLLLDTPRTLEQIAALTGFADANHFCKVFRRHFHLSPGAFRRRMT